MNENPRWRWLLLLVALVGGAWLLMADSTECAGEKNEALCEKCGLEYREDPALCEACDDEFCFRACMGNQDIEACAQRYHDCLVSGEDRNCIRETTCEGATDIDTESCEKCGHIGGDDVAQALCQSCSTGECFDLCTLYSSLYEGREQSVCVQQYDDCVAEGVSGVNLDTCMEAGLRGSQ